MMTQTITWAKKIKKNRKKLKELSLLEKKKDRKNVRKLWKMPPCVCHCSQGYRSNLKALYTGRYQQTKEQGVKRMAQRMARPRPTPLPEGSTQNMAREDTTLKSSVAAQTEQSRRVGKRRFYYSQQHRRLTHTYTTTRLSIQMRTGLM